MLIPLILAALVDGVDDRAQRGRLHELSGRLGMGAGRRGRLTREELLKRKILRIWKQHGPHVYWVVMGWIDSSGIEMQRITSEDPLEQLDRLLGPLTAPLFVPEDHVGLVEALPWLATQVKLQMDELLPPPPRHHYVAAPGEKGHLRWLSQLQAMVPTWLEWGPEASGLAALELGRRGGDIIWSNLLETASRRQAETPPALVSVLDWIHEANPEDLHQLSYADIGPRITDWYAAQVPYEVKPETPRPGRFVAEIDDWTLQDLTTKKLLLQEGHILRHCVGSPKQPYIAKVLAGKTKIFSLRDEDGLPRVTFELELEPDGSPGKLLQAKGYRDAMPPDIAPGYIRWDREEVLEVVAEAARIIQRDSSRWRAEVRDLILYGATEEEILEMIRSEANHLDQNSAFAHSLYERLRELCLWKGWVVWAEEIIGGSRGDWMPPEVGAAQVYELHLPDVTDEDRAAGRGVVMQPGGKEFGPSKIPPWLEMIEEGENYEPIDEVPIFLARLTETANVPEGLLTVLIEILIAPADYDNQSMSFAWTGRVGARLESSEGAVWESEKYKEIAYQPWRKKVLEEDEPNRVIDRDQVHMWLALGSPSRSRSTRFMDIVKEIFKWFRSGDWDSEIELERLIAPGEFMTLDQLINPERFLTHLTTMTANEYRERLEREQALRERQMTLFSGAP